MIRKLTYSTVLVVIALAGMIHSGCTGTDVLTTPIGTVTVQIETTNQGMSRFDQATVFVSQVYFRPVDPEADTNMGNFTLGVFPSRDVLIDLNGSVDSSFSLSLSAGRYRLSRIVIRPAELIDNDPAPDPPVVCTDNFQQIPTPQSDDFLTIDPPFNVVFDPAVAPTFTISNEDSIVRLVLDSHMIIDHYVESFRCRTSGRNCSFYGPVTSPPCLYSFDSSGYTSSIQDAFYFAQ